MTISTYSDLKAAIATWLARSDLTSVIPDLISFAEGRIYRDLRIKAMEADLDVTISGGLIDVPGDYIALKYAYIDADPVQILERKTAGWIYGHYPDRGSTGIPASIAREGDNFIFGPSPGGAYNVKGVYYKKLAPLSDANPSNWFLANVPDLLLYGALIEAEGFVMNDNRTAFWQAKYEDIKASLSDNDDAENLSSSVGLSLTSK